MPAEPIKIYVVRHRPTGMFTRGYKELVTSLRGAMTRVSYQQAIDSVILGVRDGGMKGKVTDYEVVELTVTETSSTPALAAPVHTITVT